jgi:hypothetical protein
MAAASPRMMAAVMTPWPPEPLKTIPVVSIIYSLAVSF